MTSSRSDDSRPLPAGVRFEGVVWSDEHVDVKRRLDTRKVVDKEIGPTTEERVFAVARYVFGDTWRIDIGWEPFVPDNGPGELSVYPLDYHLDATDDGIPTSVLRSIPMRHARIALRQAISRKYAAVWLEFWKAEAFETDKDWAKLAMACVLLRERGIDQLGATLHEIWPSATSAVWNSRIHRLRRSGRGSGRGYLTTGDDGSLTLSPEAVRLVAAIQEESR